MQTIGEAARNDKSEASQVEVDLALSPLHGAHAVQEEPGAPNSDSGDDAIALDAGQRARCCRDGDVDCSTPEKLPNRVYICIRRGEGGKE